MPRSFLHSFFLLFLFFDLFVVFSCLFVVEDLIWFVVAKKIKVYVLTNDDDKGYLLAQCKFPLVSLRKPR